MLIDGVARLPAGHAERFAAVVRQLAARAQQAGGVRALLHALLIMERERESGRTESEQNEEEKVEFSCM